MFAIRKQQVNVFVMYYLNITSSFLGSQRNVAMVAERKNQLRFLARNRLVGSSIPTERDAKEVNDAVKWTRPGNVSLICASITRSSAESFVRVLTLLYGICRERCCHKCPFYSRVVLPCLPVISSQRGRTIGRLCVSAVRRCRMGRQRAMGWPSRILRSTPIAEVIRTTEHVCIVRYHGHHRRDTLNCPTLDKFPGECTFNS